MHLTHSETCSHGCAVASDFSGAAGAPRNEIEITPEMIDALEEAFIEWWGENDYLLRVGLPGDVVDLRLRLNAALANSLISALDVPREL
jgi:hypothetical protein